MAGFTRRRPNKSGRSLIAAIFLVYLWTQNHTAEAFPIGSRTGTVPYLIQPPSPKIAHTTSATRSSQTRLSLRESNNNNADQKQGQGGWISLSERTKGLAVLLTVPFAWGTYVPVVRYLYEIQPAVPGFVFSACYYAVASFTTLSIVAFQDRKTAASTLESTDDDDNNNNVLPGGEVSVSDKKQTGSSFPILGGMELGLYLFLGNCLQVVGLQTVAADRAGFLVQLTTVMVPVTEALFAGRFLAIPARTWLSCFLAFLGICVMNLDGISQGSISSMMVAFKTFTQGDVLILSAAVLYTLHVVRLGRYAKETTPMKLAASKATVETVLSSTLVFGLMSFAAGSTAATGGLPAFLQATGTEISTFFSTITKSFAAGTVPQSAIISAVGATLWTGLVTCAYTIFAQSYGQKRVGPSDANLIYSFQPICTALFAFILLGETMGPAGVVGGGFIAAAVYLVTMMDDGNVPKEDEDSENNSKTPELEPLQQAEMGRLRNTTEVLIKR